MSGGDGPVVSLTAMASNLCVAGLAFWRFAEGYYGTVAADCFLSAAVVLLILLNLLYLNTWPTNVYERFFAVQIGVAYLAVLVVLFASIYAIVGVHDALSSTPGVPSTDGRTCLYFSVATFTPLGYGDVTPTAAARPYAAAAALLGYFGSATLVGLVVSALKRHSPAPDAPAAP